MVPFTLQFLQTKLCLSDIINNKYIVPVWNDAVVGLVAGP